MAARHVEPVVLWAAEAQVGAALRQPDEADRLALRIEHHHAVEVLGPSFQLIHLAAADLGRLLVERAGAPPAAPEIAVSVDPKAVERPLVGVDQLGLAAHRAVRADVVAPDAAVGRALPFDDV